MKNLEVCFKQFHCQVLSNIKFFIIIRVTKWVFKRVRRQTSALSGRLDELWVKIDTRREPAVLTRQTGGIAVLQGGTTKATNRGMATTRSVEAPLHDWRFLLPQSPSCPAPARPENSGFRNSRQLQIWNHDQQSNQTLNSVSPSHPFGSQPNLDQRSALLISALPPFRDPLFQCIVAHRDLEPLPFQVEVAFFSVEGLCHSWITRVAVAGVGLVRSRFEVKF